MKLEENEGGVMVAVEHGFSTVKVNVEAADL